MGTILFCQASFELKAEPATEAEAGSEAEANSQGEADSGYEAEAPKMTNAGQSRPLIGAHPEDTGSQYRQFTDTAFIVIIST